MHTSNGPFSNLARNLAQVVHSPVACVVASFILAVQAVVSIKGGPEYVSEIYFNLGLSRHGFLAGKIWEMVTYGVLHGSFWHAALNALFVLLLGSRIETITGRGMFLRVLVLGVIGGGIGHLLLGADLLVGLSGGCLALLICLTTLSPQSRMFPLPLSGRSLGLGIILAELIFAVIDPAAHLPYLRKIGQYLIDSGYQSWFLIGHACHLGGGIAGWFCARWILRPRITLKRLRRERSQREAS